MEIKDGSSKTLMVDERQTVRDVMDNLFEKTHCDCNVDWCVCETNPDLQTGEYHPCTHKPACSFVISFIRLDFAKMMKCVFTGALTARLQ